MANKNNGKNYLADLNAARAAKTGGQQPSEEKLKQSLTDIKAYSKQLSVVSNEDLEEVNDLMDKVDNLSSIFEKYAHLQEKMDSLKANAAQIEAAVGTLTETAQEAAIDPFHGLTEDQTYAINVQVIKEFEAESRLSRDLLTKSEAQVLEDTVPDDVPAFAGLTKEQTVQVYMQVIDEFLNETDLASRLAYNAGVE